MSAKKNVIVLGASGNVGGAALKSFLEANYCVLAPYRSPDALAKIKKGLGPLAGHANLHIVQADIGSYGGAAALEKAAGELFGGKIDHVVSSVGPWRQTAPLHDLPVAAFKDVMNSNFEPHAFVYQHLAKHMLNTPNAGYTFVMGMAAKNPDTNLMYFTQNAILSYSKIAQAQTRSTALRVNVLSIGLRVEDNDVFDGLPADAKATSNRLLPSRDFGPVFVAIAESTDKGQLWEVPDVPSWCALQTALRSAKQV